MATKNMCSVCGQGSVGFRILSDKKTLVLMCDECDTVWLNWESLLNDKHLFAIGVDLKIPDTEISLKSSRWATREEVLSHSLENNIVDEVIALDE